MSKGRLWRHDAPGAHRGPDGVLVSCAGSLVIVDVVARPATQLAFDLDEDQPEADTEAPALFLI